MVPAAFVQERPHRLPRRAYVGQVSVVFTACEARRQFLFGPGVVPVFLDMLTGVLARSCCTAPVYCFMPDHLHLIIQGQNEASDTRGAMVRFKQTSGFWLQSHIPHRVWQKDFWDHVIRSHEDLGAQVRYIAENPVRRGLAGSWKDYPYTGAIGHDLSAVLLEAAI